MEWLTMLLALRLVCLQTREEIQSILSEVHEGRRREWRTALCTVGRSDREGHLGSRISRLDRLLQQASQSRTDRRRRVERGMRESVELLLRDESLKLRLSLCLLCRIGGPGCASIQSSQEGGVVWRVHRSRILDVREGLIILTRSS